MTDQIDRPLEPVSFTTVFAQALRGEPCSVVGLDETPALLPVDSWAREADAADLEILRLCEGPVLDIGCGPGRMAAALIDSGVIAIGIDVVPEAVDQAVGRGAPALRRDVFGALPGEGAWATALLADGNLGIGGDPVHLLARVRELLAPGGRVVVEVAGPGVPAKTVWASIESTGTRSSRFRWAVVGVDDIAAVGAAAGLRVDDLDCHGGRWVAVLRAAT